MKAFPIDFVRQALEQTLLEEHIKNPNLYGGENQVTLFSFYEQLVKDEEVNRYIEKYRDLVEQQNRSGIIMNGTIVAPENPSITNLYSCKIIPMTFTCNFRVKLANRDTAIDTINHLIDELKGTKVDIAELDNGQLVKVGTIFDKIESGVFLNCDTTSQDVENEINRLVALGLSNDLHIGDYIYCGYEDNVLRVFTLTENGWIEGVKNNPEIPVLPSHEEYKQYKLSLSFDSIRCDEPRTLNADEYCTISFGGSATLVNRQVKLGNDLVRVGIRRKKLIAKTTTDYTDNFSYLEPLEMPSGNSADTQANQLISNSFITNSHTDSLSLSLQYTFIANDSERLIREWFKYARYGLQDFIKPNIIYEIKEIWCSWGKYEPITFLAKIVESIDIDNTESDTLTITIPLQIQGENN